MFQIYTLILWYMLQLFIGCSEAQQQLCPYVTGLYNYNGSRAVNLHLNELEPFTCSEPPAVCLEPESPYRSLDGSCYNEQHPEWGMPYRRYGRLLSADYGDGYSSPTRSESGKELPLVRVLSTALFKNKDVPDVNLTMINMFFGQFVTHDSSLLAGSVSTLLRVTKCCTAEGKMRPIHERHRLCFPQRVPRLDPLYGPYGVQCLSTQHIVSDKDVQCNDRPDFEPAEKLTIVTPWLDLSHVYGNSDAENRQLRYFKDGLLATVERNGYEWPMDVENGKDRCKNTNEDGVCYLMGDIRSNQNTGISILQIVFLREHNRLARELKLLNPFWPDCKLFHEARRINIASYQKVVYYEWLPLMLSTEEMLANKLIYTSFEGKHVNDYNATANPAPLLEHSHSAFRFFHSQVEGTFRLLNEEREFRMGQTIMLSDAFFRPEIIEENGHYDGLIRCFVTQPQQTTDRHYDPEIQGRTFRFGKEVGSDLLAVDLMRGRDSGLPSYNKYRALTSLPRAESWEDYADVFEQADIEIMKLLYETWEDVDLTVGGIFERHVEGTLVGPTFKWILLEQFRRYRQADRYFFENGHDENTRFTEDQLFEIRKSSMARLLCDNSNNVENMQASAFTLLSDENLLQSCDSLPFVDMAAWRDPTAQEN